jgi:hypothetical protein
MLVRFGVAQPAKLFTTKGTKEHKEIATSEWGLPE